MHSYGLFLEVILLFMLEDWVTDNIMTITNAILILFSIFVLPLTESDESGKVTWLSKCKS